MPADVPDIDPALVDQPSHEARANVETLGDLIDREKTVKRAVASE